MRGVAGLLGLITSLGVACGGVPAPTETAAERFEAPEAEAAKERAPDVYAAAERAWRQAEEARSAGDVDAAADHAARARLLLAAAVAEADRIAVEERRLALEARARELDAQASRDLAARHELQEEMERREAARVAAEQAGLAFQRAESDETRRYGRQRAQRERMYQEATVVILRRANTIVAAAEALGAEEDLVTQAIDRIEEAERVREPVQAIAAAERALRDALAALGNARARREGPSPDERAALVDQARELGFEVEQRDRGLAVVAEDIFRGSATRPLPGSAGRLARLAALVEAHPHGPVQVTAYGTGRAGRRIADARAAAVVSELTDAGASEERLSAESVIDGVPDDEGSIEVVFLGYGPDASEAQRSAGASE